MIWQVWGERQDGTQRLLCVVYRSEAADLRREQAMNGKQFTKVFIRTLEREQVHETT